jgi:hypothetical protein
LQQNRWYAVEIHNWTIIRAAPERPKLRRPAALGTDQGQ